MAPAWPGAKVCISFAVPGWGRAVGFLRGHFAELCGTAVRIFSPGSSFHPVPGAAANSMVFPGGYGVRVIGVVHIHGHTLVDGLLDLAQIAALSGIAK